MSQGAATADLMYSNFLIFKHILISFERWGKNVITTAELMLLVFNAAKLIQRDCQR